MARVVHGYRCSACGWRASAYAGRCLQCREWNTMREFLDGPALRGGAGRHREPVTVALPDVPDDVVGRVLTDIPEFDRVLGGGLVPGSLVLVGGEPGIGKSTLVLEAAARMAMRGVAVAYVCGEESLRQVRLRAGRLGVEQAPVRLVAETDIEAALDAAGAAGSRVVILDSIQALSVEGLEARIGGPAQLAEAASRIQAWAKGNDVAAVVTGHVTKTGDIAGPRLLEHLVDAVLYFEGAEGGALRVLRAVKNRFGATDEVGVFEMTGTGLQSVENMSAAFLESGRAPSSGCAVTATVEGSRAIAVEVQALAVPSYLAAPRRIASGVEVSRVHLLLAVLARRAGLQSGSLDIVVGVTGGLRLRDPGTDLAVAAALASAIKDRPLAASTALLGEVALSGAVRPAPGASRRLAELERAGFRRCIGFSGPDGTAMEVTLVSTLKEALAAAFGEGG